MFHLLTRILQIILVLCWLRWHCSAVSIGSFMQGNITRVHVLTCRREGYTLDTMPMSGSFSLARGSRRTVHCSQRYCVMLLLKDYQHMKRSERTADFLFHIFFTSLHSLFKNPSRLLHTFLLSFTSANLLVYSLIAEFSSTSPAIYKTLLLSLTLFLWLNKHRASNTQCSNQFKNPIGLPRHQPPTLPS